MATVMAEPARRTGRGIEMLLLVLALVVGLGGYALTDLNQSGVLSTEFKVTAVVLAVVAVGAHVVLRLRANYADPVILPIVVALNGIGLSMIHRLDLAKDGSSAATRQLMWSVIGAVAACAVLWLVRDHRLLRRITFTSLIGGIVLLLMPMLPIIGKEIHGARIWIHLGPLSFQPGEIAKILLAIFMAGYLVINRDNLALAGPRFLGLQLPRPRHMGPLLVAWGASLAILVFQRDLGTSLLFFGLFVATLYVATERPSWIIIGLALFTVGVILAVSLFPHVGARFDVWLNALDPEVYNRQYGGSGQVVQGLFGLASGGLTGAGWGMGFPYLVPFANSDFIMTSLGEELGLTGMLGILALYLVLVERGFRAGLGVRDGFGKLLAVGLSFVMAFQVFVVVGGVTRLIPLTGLTTPFLALGGSSMLSNWIVIALLLRISHATRSPSPAPLSPTSAAEIIDRLGAKQDEDDDAIAWTPDHTVGESSAGTARPSADAEETTITPVITDPLAADAADKEGRL